jgi:DNA-binding response OmpR family regulator
VDLDTTRAASALVIEDDEHMAYLLTFMLERVGFAVTAIDNGSAAERLIDEGRTAGIVLLDLMLPQVDGFQLLLRMREQADWKHVPVIVVSARSAENDVVRAFELGADDYVTKPFRPHELLARIHRLTQTFPGKR